MKSDLYTTALNCLLQNTSEDGFTASSKNDVYGCFFGRDSALTILKVLRSHTKSPQLPLLEISKKSLLTMISLQGKEFNLESGEQPGKFIHEFRKNNYERLLNLEKPWYVYPNGYLKNYDSVDSTPLGLIALYKYQQITGDGEFLITVLPAIENALNWILLYGDLDKDSLIEYELHKDRIHGGLPVQSWTDSHYSLRNTQGKMPNYPIAPVEAQGYAWLALKLWGDFYKDHSPSFAAKLLRQAEILKQKFNQMFLFKDGKYLFASQALDGDKNQINTITGNPLLCLWASYVRQDKVESIIEDKYIESLVERAFQNDLFDKDGGIRTMSTLSKTYNPNADSYHNGSFWPILNGLAHEGLENFGFKKQADLLKEASLKPLLHFGSPIELYIKSESGEYLEFLDETGQKGCKEQAWSAAAMLDLLA